MAGGLDSVRVCVNVCQYVMCQALYVCMCVCGSMRASGTICVSQFTNVCRCVLYLKR